MTISLIIQGRSAYLSADIQNVLKDQSRKVATAPSGLNWVARTNVPHSDDPEMQRLLEHRRKEYKFGLEDPAPKEVNASHQLDQSLLNLSGHILLIDSFNLHISNTWLRNNSRPYEETAALLRREAQDVGEAIRLLETSRSFTHIVVLTSEVQTDFNVSSPDLAQYAEYIAEANGALISYLQDSGLSPDIYIAGTVLPRLSSTKDEYL